MSNFWQLYDEQGRALKGQGATNDDVYTKGLLHSGSHVWIWRGTSEGAEILLQKRAATMRTWPGRYDISAAGHVDLGEDPLTTALRETKEEIGVELTEDQLQFIGIERRYRTGPDKTWIENEFSWLYLLEATPDMTFALEDGEVEMLEWKDQDQISSEIEDAVKRDLYVPHGATYFRIIFEAINRAAVRN